MIPWLAFAQSCFQGGAQFQNARKDGLAEILWAQPQKAAPWFRSGAPRLKCPDTQGRTAQPIRSYRLPPRHPGKTTTTNGSLARSGIKSSPSRSSVNCALSYQGRSSPGRRRTAQPRIREGRCEAPDLGVQSLPHRQVGPHRAGRQRRPRRRSYRRRAAPLRGRFEIQRPVEPAAARIVVQFVAGIC
jgi:hypothetical protein